MQMNYLLLFSDWFLSDEKIPQFVWVKKARNFLCGLWKVMENDKKWLVCEQKSYKYFRNSMINVSM